MAPAETEAGNIYVLIADSTARLGTECLSALDPAYGLLAPGGTLLIRLTPLDFTAATGIISINQR